jgi:uncharacterized protein involved in type VI secretion and phage assembly
MIYPITETMGLPYDVAGAEVFSHTHVRSALEASYSIIDRWSDRTMFVTGRVLFDDYSFQAFTLDKVFSNGMDAYLTHGSGITTAGPYLVIVRRNSLRKLAMSRSDLAVKYLHKNLRAA